MAVKSEAKTLAIITHVLALFIGFLGPLIILLVGEEKFVKKNAKKALNWQISLLIYGAVSGILALVIVGIFLLIALGIMNTVFVIIAAIKASEEEAWDYPLTIPFFST